MKNVELVALRISRYVRLSDDTPIDISGRYLDRVHDALDTVYKAANYLRVDGEENSRFSLFFYLKSSQPMRDIYFRADYNTGCSCTRVNFKVSAVFGGIFVYATCEDKQVSDEILHKAAMQLKAALLAEVAQEV